jgi:hypothetical protein
MVQLPDPSRFPFTFDCRRSGNCCARPGGIVRVTDADVGAIAVHLGMPESAVRSRFVGPDGSRLRDGLGHRCVFLDDGTKPRCTIYPVRPEYCRRWPFVDELRDDPARLAEAAQLCPGIRLRPESDPAT